jgi:hypothetical protein
MPGLLNGCNNKKLLKNEAMSHFQKRLHIEIKSNKKIPTKVNENHSHRRM